MTGTMATRAEALFSFTRRRRKGNNLKIKRIAPKKKAATRATCRPEMDWKWSYKFTLVKLLIMLHPYPSNK